MEAPRVSEIDLNIFQGQMVNEIIQTRTINIWLDEVGIMRIVARHVTSPGITGAHENIAVIEDVGQGKRRPALVDIREAVSVEDAGRRLYMQERVKEMISAAAFIVSSPISRVIGSLFVGVTKLSFPVRLFTSEAEAVRWLKSYLE
jgi:hypothetical protein